MRVSNMRSKILSEASFGIAVLLLAVYQVVYQLPQSPHYHLKLAGIAVQAALSVFLLASAVGLARREKRDR